MTQLQKSLKVQKMLSLFNPTVLLGIVLALFGAFEYGHHVATVEQAAEIARLNQEAVAQKEKHDDNLHKEKVNAQNKINALQSAVASGSVRLSIATSQVQCSASAAGDAEARAELDPKVGADLIAITGEGDQAIIELNNCIDRYNDLRTLK